MQGARVRIRPGVAAPAPVIVGTSVLRSNTGSGDEVIGFAIVFSAAMDPASAESDANYRLFELERVGGRDVPRGVAVRVTFDAALNTLVLGWVRAHAFLLGGQLTINGMPPDGLRAVTGNFLDGSGQGTPGTDAELAVLPGARGLVLE